MQVKEYALYKGEQLLAMGTKREIAEQLGVSPSTVGYYGTPVYAVWRIGMRGINGILT